MGIESLLTASPTTKGHTAEPYSVDEIDQLLNADRVWATIVALRNHMRGDAEVDEGGHKARLQKASKACETLRDCLATLQTTPMKEHGAAVVEALEQLETILEDE